MYAHFPGLRVVVPSTPTMPRGCCKHALRCDDPVLFLEHREIAAASRARCPTEDYEIEFGQAARRPRRAATSPSSRWRGWCIMTLAACDELAREGISVEVIDPRTVSPLDTDTILQSVAQDRPAADRRRAARTVRLRRRDRRPGRRRRLRRPRCADPPADRGILPTPYSPPRSAVVPRPQDIAAGDPRAGEGVTMCCGNSRSPARLVDGGRDLRRAGSRTTATPCRWRRRSSSWKARRRCKKSRPSTPASSPSRPMLRSRAWSFGRHLLGYLLAAGEASPEVAAADSRPAARSRNTASPRARRVAGNSASTGGNSKRAAATAACAKSTFVWPPSSASVKHRSSHAHRRKSRLQHSPRCFRRPRGGRSSPIGCASAASGPSRSR